MIWIVVALWLGIGLFFYFKNSWDPTWHYSWQDHDYVLLPVLYPGALLGGILTFAYYATVFLLFDGMLENNGE